MDSVYSQPGVSTAPDYTAYESQYAGQIQDLTEQLGSREPFTYDPGADPSYQAYAEHYRNAGEQARKDTLARAAALVGGQASTYAVAAAPAAIRNITMPGKPGSSSRTFGTAVVDNSLNGEYNGKESNFGLVDHSYSEDTNAEQETVLYSGAINGAYNDRNDPDASKRNEHAARYYQELRNSNKDAFVMSVAKYADLDPNVVSKAYKHIFEDTHHLEGGYVYFEPDYDMAETFRRLRTNDQIQRHDIILLYHEALEYDLMQENPYMTYDEAHEIAQQRYNYKAALMEWLRKRGE